MSFKSLYNIVKRTYIPVTSYQVQGGPRPQVYLEFKIENTNAGRVVFELYKDVAPFTVENFRRIANGEAKNPKGKALTYKNSQVYKVIPRDGIYCGDITQNNGLGGDSIYGEHFKDENFSVLHDRPGLLTTLNTGVNRNNSKFLITLNPAQWLDYKSTVFGQVLSGIEVLKEIERYGKKTGEVSKKITISDSGELEVKVDDHHHDAHHH
eukprot:CAMPEP_0176428466 /NCGR_PEP_ID=MMETSP0127-20121128/13166_1 /TAXON_ID=938130 /ORGANISM="Platyophrya macrostoma, Strain WH" /LENGTH=208 /DNA_ID=CAMNT_0017810153 /DNA_START=43 /DNA_END=669 /DNA_ORIENTATION=-